MARRILLHVCCGPCAIAPVRHLLEAGWDVTGLFYNPNIQPAMEYLRRRDALARVASILGVEIVYGDYDPVPHMRAALADPENRCGPCFASRLDRTAELAAARGCDAFSSTLLYSKYQDHETLRRLGALRADARGVPFYYQDFRVLWDEGVALSREWGIYRQPYCGCVLSELDRYAKKLRRPPVVEG